MAISQELRDLAEKDFGSFGGTFIFALEDVQAKQELSDEETEEIGNIFAAEFTGRTPRKFLKSGFTFTLDQFAENVPSVSSFISGLAPLAKEFTKKSEDERLKSQEEALGIDIEFPGAEDEDPDARRQRILGRRQEQQIEAFRGEFETRGDVFRQRFIDQQTQGRTSLLDTLRGDARTARSSLEEGLDKRATGVFERQNPFLLEDLRARGLFTSPSAVADRQGEFIRDLELANQGTLSAFDIQNFGDLQQLQAQISTQDKRALSSLDFNLFGQEEDLRGAGLTSVLGGEQSALDFDIAGRLRQQERDFQTQFSTLQFEQEANLAQSLARRRSRDSLVSSLIGFGGSIGGGALSGRSSGTGAT